MYHADPLYTLAHLHQHDLLRAAELARVADAARRPAAPPRRLRLALATALLSRLPAAPGVHANDGSPAHA